MEDIDRSLLDLIQHDFPVTKRPFLELGEKLGVPEKEIITRLQNLKNEGYIRRIGGIFDTNKLGFTTTLVAAEVLEDKVDEVAERVNQYQGVTHNYKRDHQFNLWFTVAAETEEILDKILSDINNFEGVIKVRKLPQKKLFKIGVKLPLT